MTDIKALRAEVERYFTNGNQFDRMATAEQIRALLDELAEKRKLCELHWRCAQRATDRYHAAEAKLAKVREFADNILVKPEYPLGTVGQFRQDGEVGIARCILAILDAEPPTATVQPTAEGEQGLDGKER